MLERRIYFLDLQTLLAYLKDQSCELMTELKISGKVARGSILLEEGMIARCSLVYQNGTQVSGEQALKQLEAATQWQVELASPDGQEKAPPPQFAPRSPFAEQFTGATSTPWLSPPLRQKRALDPAFLQSLPGKERMIMRSVFLLINGRRSCEEIKAQLPFSSWEIEHAVNRLRALGVIE